ncbi:MAG: DNA translocase FtsK [Thermodesulfobacteriota bacterium]|nr:DNA translocase FtsK [Thermodesulfobacteriota bacterium]
MGRKKTLKWEIIGIILLVVVVYLLASLFTYHPLDQSFNAQAKPATMPRNICGVFGAYIADMLFQILGLTSFVITLSLLVISLLLITGFKITVDYITAFGCFAIIISVSTLFSLIIGETNITGYSINSGGILGGFISKLSVDYINYFGSYLFFFLLLFLGIMLSIEISTAEILARIASGTKKLLKRGKKKKKVSEKKSEKRDFNPSLMYDDLAVPVISRQEQNQENDQRNETSAFHTRHTISIGEYTIPPLSYLNDPAHHNKDINIEKIKQNVEILIKKLQDFGVEGKVVEVNPGPVITMYEFEPAPGIKINKITNLADDLAMALKSMSVRVVAPIAGKSVIGIEVPNTDRETVFLKEILESDLFLHADSELTIALGKDIFGNPVVSDLAKMPHLLIAGSTGSGKSVSLNSIIISLLYRITPDDVKMIMIDPKRLEFSLYDGILHLLHPVVMDPKEAAIALKWAVREMEKRYDLLSMTEVRNISQYNDKVETMASLTSSNDMQDGNGTLTKLPYIIIVIDELADLMMISSREVEESITRLAQMARAAGIHLIVATQRPSVDVITGLIKVNFPVRISFKVSSRTDSRTILDTQGAERLLGFGDMLFLSQGTSKLKRIHAPYITESEIANIVAYIKSYGEPVYNETLLSHADEKRGTEDAEYDEKYDKAVALVAELRQASTSLLQRYLRIGYNRAARIIDRMEEEGVIGPSDGVKPRQVLIDKL